MSRRTTERRLRGRPVARARRDSAKRRRAALVLAVAAGLLGVLCTTASARIAARSLGAQPLVANPKVTQQPTNVTVEEPAPAGFTSAASGSPSVQWEESVNEGTSWQPIPGATSGTYTIAATSTSESGHRFRALFTNAEGGSITSKAATLTVTAKPVVTVQPASISVEQTKEAVFESRASGSPAPTVQWQESTDGGQVFKNIAGSQNQFRIGGVSENMDGWEFRAVFKNSRGETVSQAATLHVVEAPVFTIQPEAKTVVEGQSVNFFSSAHGRPVPSEQWQVSVDNGATWQPVEGATSSTLTLASTTGSENGNLYRVVDSNSIGSTTSQSAKLTVQSKPLITEQPQPQTVLLGTQATFTAAATGPPEPTVQWEESLNEGAAWSAISGATSGEITVSDAQLSESGREYRAVFTNVAGSTISERRDADGRRDLLPRLRLGTEHARPDRRRVQRIDDHGVRLRSPG